MEEDLIEFRVKLGNRIKEIRKSKGLTQPQLGSLINKDYQDISRLENGKVNPSAFYIWQISKALKIDIEDIYNF
ncbi:helix-turn-helix domain-containing protein [Cecembia rubra]|uniref:Putative transcriptional regulator n=1 Tax=Cecembia rubra TaxID=1485585 RepID=A0A2P8DVJ6_9BACT|nr:helix-turn-helix transcriptional regulator [Cecembia rubra]PSL01242.1 putative transcriptional regulator [Cecembia rubra]